MRLVEVMQSTGRTSLGYLIPNFDHKAHGLHQRSEGSDEGAVHSGVNGADHIGCCSDSGPRRVFGSTWQMSYRAGQSTGRSIFNADHELAGALFLALQQ